MPATTFETAGAEVNDSDVDKLLSRREINYLAEMMNWPGVLKGDASVFNRINAAKRRNKIVDGHAPGLRGQQARTYIDAGISTDHECSTAEEALEKLEFGMKILIREGSAARNFDALADLINDHWKEMMFCSDDKHPDSLEVGHINLLVKRAVDRNIDLFKVLTVACVNPVQHYNLDVGQLRNGDAADFILVQDLKSFTVLKTFINGELVAENGTTRISRRQNTRLNNFKTSHKRPSDFEVKATGTRIRVIEPSDGQLTTREVITDAKINDGLVMSDPKMDILKITVVNRYADTKPAVAFVKNFGLKHGAIASSVSHDSHNIISVGVDDVSICHAINQVIDSKGGVVAFDGETSMILPLPVAGIMSDNDGYAVSKKYQTIDKMAKQMGSRLGAPFMTLSFMALLVIPEIKLSDKGLFDASGFRFVDLFVE